MEDAPSAEGDTQKHVPPNEARPRVKKVAARFIAVVGGKMKSGGEHPVPCRSTSSGPELAAEGQKPKGIALSAMNCGALALMVGEFRLVRPGGGGNMEGSAAFYSELPGKHKK